MNPALITRRDGAVLILSNNNPDARNALSRTQVDDLVGDYIGIGRAK